MVNCASTYTAALLRPGRRKNRALGPASLEGGRTCPWARSLGLSAPGALCVGFRRGTPAPADQREAQPPSDRWSRKRYSRRSVQGPVHHSAIVGGGYRSLAEGGKVSYEAEAGQNGSQGRQRPVGLAIPLACRPNRRRGETSRSHTATRAPRRRFGLPAVVSAVHGNSRDSPRDLDAQAGVARGRTGQTPLASVPQPPLVGPEEASGAAGFGGLVAHVEARLAHGECAPGTRAVAWRRTRGRRPLRPRPVALAAPTSSRPRSRGLCRSDGRSHPLRS